MGGSERTHEWFRDWFGEEYLAIYPHRDEREARDAVRLYREAVSPPADTLVLDLACGAGRHLRDLSAGGLAAIGLDLSMTLLRRARGTGEADPLVRGDMRVLPFRDAAFGGLTSFFTSFGYFDDPADDRRVLGEMNRVLQAGGSFMLDFLNADRVRRDLVEQDTRRIRGKRIVQRRSIIGDTVVKTITIQPLAGGATRRFQEQVRLYTRLELEALLDATDLPVTHCFGDYDGSPAGPTSPRLILAGRSGQPRSGS